jgi:hypothetical protein
VTEGVRREAHAGDAQLDLFPSQKLGAWRSVQN